MDFDRVLGGDGAFLTYSSLKYFNQRVRFVLFVGRPENFEVSAYYIVITERCDSRYLQAMTKWT